jgi:hypothetical protein
MNKTPVLDLPRIHRLMEFCGIESSRDLARRSGLNEGEVSRYLRGQREPGFTNLQLLARGLGVAVPAITTWPGDPWHYAPQTDRRAMDELFQFLGHAKCLLSLTPNFGSHLLPAELHFLKSVEEILAAYGNPEAANIALRYHRHVQDQRIAARVQCDYILKIYTSSSTLSLAARTNPQWLEEIAYRMVAYAERTAVGFIPDEAWPRIYQVIKTQLRDVPWVKVNVADNTVVCVYTRKDVYFSLDEKIVAGAKRLIEHDIAEELPYWFPTEGKENWPHGKGTEHMRIAHRMAIEYLNEHWRGKNLQPMAASSPPHVNYAMRTIAENPQP